MGMAAGSAVTSATTQYLETGEVKGTKLALDTAVGTGLGKVAPGLKDKPGSMVHVATVQMTKIANGTTKNPSLKTLAKITTVDLVAGATPAIAGQVVDQTGAVNKIDQLLEANE